MEASFGKLRGPNENRVLQVEALKRPVPTKHIALSGKHAQFELQQAHRVHHLYCKQVFYSNPRGDAVLGPTPEWFTKD